MVASGRDDQAEEFYRTMLGSFYKQQTVDDDRFHKGLPYHNLAVVLGVRNRHKEAAKHFILAYIEDLLTFSESASGYMASRALRMLDFPPNLMESILSATVSRRVNPPLAPEHIYNGFSQEVTAISLAPLSREAFFSLITTETSQGLSSVVQVLITRLVHELNRGTRLAIWATIIAILGLIVSLTALTLQFLFQP